MRSRGQPALQGGRLRTLVILFLACLISVDREYWAESLASLSYR